jgi:hypothetical protein
VIEDGNWSLDDQIRDQYNAGADPNDIASKIGKSRNYVVRRLDSSERWGEVKHRPDRAPRSFPGLHRRTDHRWGCGLYTRRRYLLHLAEGAMTADDRYRLGTGKYRLGASQGVGTIVSITDGQRQMLEKLRLVKGYHASEVIDVALESLFFRTALGAGRKNHEEAELISELRHSSIKEPPSGTEGE